MSSNTQFSNSGDKNTEVYSSSTVHRHIVLTNGGAIALLQVADQSTDAADNKHITIFSFCVFFLIYAVLAVIEVKLTTNQPDQTIRHFVGYVSHLFGALAALTLISLVSPIFTLIVAPLWLVWFFFIMYVVLTKLIWVEINNHPGEANPSDQTSQL
ncbi:hypothetical protein CARUB_v10010967mg [Capsella rubella]|uniref:Uncharacterized protein n=1 Tax=Capsella rubella TaxID=81985 RepID=R0GKX8_9BRAS|nr:uncharacterized protein LOC17899982 [Capsella rubella]EOA36431.1 hypothetical protein CARUB_v10010967mg [Capsella rubella]